jgi:predicted nucleotidyltransferase
MREIDSLDSLNIPDRYKEYLGQYLANISDIPYIHTVYLFGSCATETVKRYSDIDLFITTDREISDDEDWEIAVERRPEYSKKSIPMDIIIQPDSLFHRFTDNIAMVQNQVVKKGVILNGLLLKRC